MTMWKEGAMKVPKLMLMVEPNRASATRGIYRPRFFRLGP